MLTHKMYKNITNETIKFEPCVVNP